MSTVRSRPPFVEPPINAYLITCMRDWLTDCGNKVFIRVDVTQLSDPALVSRAKDNLLTLNITPEAVKNYALDAEGMVFETRFNGVAHHVSLPLSAIILIHEASGADPTKVCFLPPLPKNPSTLMTETGVVHAMTQPASKPKAPRGETGTVVQLDAFREK